MQKRTNDLIDKKDSDKISPKKNKTELSKTSKLSKKVTTNEKKGKTTKSKKGMTGESTKKNVATLNNRKKSSTSSTTEPKTKSSTKKNTTKQKSTSKKSTNIKLNTVTKKVENLEYYDLPYRYNQTVVKILAQTPTTLFVYWDISDLDRKKYIDTFGENFFETTFPVLIVHNKTMNYSFEIEVNDFANSWYFNVNDAKCEYEIELGRRPKQNQISLPNNYMYVTSSNIIEAPNNHILFEKKQKILFFKNVKTNTTTPKDISTFEFTKYSGKIYNIYNFYKEIYKNDELENLNQLSSSKF